MSDGTKIQWTETKHLPDPNAIVLVLRVREDTMSEPLSERGYYWTDAPNGEYEILFRPDGTEVTTITEPEDRVSFRDLAPVCVELNSLQAENARLREQAEALVDALRNQGLLQNSPNGVIWHVHDCPASFDFAECNYRCRVAREAFALAGTEPYVSQETRADRATDEGRASE